MRSTLHIGSGLCGFDHAVALDEWVQCCRVAGDACLQARLHIVALAVCECSGGVCWNIHTDTLYRQHKDALTLSQGVVLPTTQLAANVLALLKVTLISQSGEL